MNTILAIDDQKSYLAKIKDVLKRAITDCKVLIAQSGAEGLQIAKSEQPDVILLDVVMPEMDGYEVCKILKADEQTHGIPIILLSGYHNDTSSRVKGLDAGATVFVSKPFDSTELIANVLAMIRISQSEKSFRKSERKYQNLFDNMLDGFAFHKIVLNKHDVPIDYTFIEVNNAFEDLTGLKRKQIIGKKVSEVIPDIKKDPSGWIEIYGNVAQTMKSARFESFSKGVNKWFSIHAYSPKKGYFITLFEDITLHKKAEEELINALQKATESDRLKSTFLAAMSHELRTPLTPIIGFSGIINEKMPIEEITSYNKTINSSGKHLLSLVDDLFDITVIEAGNLKMVKENVNVDSILNDVHNIMEAQKEREGKENITLKQVSPKQYKDLTFYTDSAKLTQILLNLLKNALKFTHEGEISYGYQVEKDKGSQVLKFYVKDTGIGIPKEKQEFIFDIFRQADDSHTRKYEGVGLGLTIAKKLVEFLGGTILLESEVGKGSTFYFTISCDEVDKSIEQISEHLTKRFNYAGKTVLIVEDVRACYDFLEVVTRKLKMKSIWAKDANEAIEYCKENTAIDLVLLDINLPYVNGYDAAAKIKKIRPELPIIAQTAYALAGDREKSLAAGCDEYIPKPIKVELLKEKIGMVLSS